MLIVITFLLLCATKSMEVDLESFVSDLVRKSRPFHHGHGQQDKCQFNYTLIDNKTIESTRRQIQMCFDGPAPDCSDWKDSKYRTADGSCNNLKRPWQGQSYSCKQRILPYDYSDGAGYPKMSCTGNEMPNARLVSNVFHREIHPARDIYTTHSMEWGQIVGHDVTLNQIYRTTEKGIETDIKCCANGPLYNDVCMSIPQPPDEDFYTKFGVTCLNFPRTRVCPCSSSGQRQHLNQNTAYLDLSTTYGSNGENASNLRTYEDGMLRHSYNKESGGVMLPLTFNEQNCVSVIPGKNSCYHSGDIRSNQTPFLLTIHTYFMRHHNFICQELSKVNPDWNDETLYQEARRINIAIEQYITYAKYLPNILGEIYYTGIISVLPGTEYTRYDPDTDATTIDEYTVVAQRYGHTLVPGPFREIDPRNFKQQHVIYVRDHYYNPYEYKFDETAKGMTVDEEMKHDQYLTDDVRDYLFRRTYLNETYGGDLAARSVIRGRDHGLPGYTYYLAHFFNYQVRSFDDLTPLMPGRAVNQLHSLYQSVHDIDVYSAGFAEYHVPGGIVGPTYAAMLMEQYNKTKFGDRYWFEHGNEAGSFTPGQLQEIKRSSLARILCDTTKIDEIQGDPFKPPSLQNPIVSCSLIHKFDFSPWQEKSIHV